MTALDIEGVVAMDPRWLILAGVIAELIGVALLASQAQDNSAGG